jgi:hypothetical protein
MKKTLQFLFFSALSVGAVAQHKPNIKQTEAPRAAQELTVKTQRASKPFSDSGNRVTIFHETFENGFNGSTELGAWNYEHYLGGVLSAEGSQWSIGTPSYSLFNNTTNNALVSASPANWALWDGNAYCDQYPTSCDGTGEFYSAYLYSPTIDCSSLESVMLSFQQTFVYCCFGVSPISVDVSVDNGSTWTTFDAIGEAVESANVFSPNPMNTVLDLTCVAAGESAVKLRFSYNSAEEDGYNFYYWGIDEVKVSDNSITSNVFIAELYNGDIINNWEFRVTPEEEINPDGMVVGARIGNNGIDDHENVRIHFELLDEDGEVAEEYTTDPFLLYGALNDTACPHVESVIVSYQTDMVPSIGTYTLRATILTDLAEDETTGAADNVMEKVVIYNNIGEFGHDPDTQAEFDFQVFSGFVNGSSGPRNPCGWGSHYTFLNPNTEAHGITVRFGSLTVAGIEFKAALIEQPASTSLDNGTLRGNGDYETLPSWVANHGGEPLYFAFNNPFPTGGVFPAQPYTNLDLFETNGTNYVAAIWRQTQGAGQLSILAEETIDTDYSSVAWEKGGDQNFHWFSSPDFNYAVRLITKAGTHIPVSVDEVNNTTSFSVYPNPAVTETRVAFDLAESKFVAYEVRDLQGRLIDTDNIGRFGAGQNSFSLNVSKYPAGNYIVGLVLDGKQIITQQFSVVK